MYNWIYIEADEIWPCGETLCWTTFWLIWLSLSCNESKNWINIGTLYHLVAAINGWNISFIPLAVQIVIDTPCIILYGPFFSPNSFQTCRCPFFFVCYKFTCGSKFS